MKKSYDFSRAVKNPYLKRILVSVKIENVCDDAKGLSCDAFVDTVASIDVETSTQGTLRCKVCGPVRCLSEIPNCHLFILIIGGRFGAEFKDGTKSVTNSEHTEAVKLKIPVFTLVEQAVHNDFQLYQANKRNPSVNAKKIAYPSANDTRIFEFIDEVRSSSVNNALVPFRDFADIESYLRQQWAGMMFSFLLRQNEAERVADTLAMLTSIGERVEMLSRQILESVGTKTAKLTAELYDRVLQHECARDMAYMKIRVTPKAVLSNDSFKQCVEYLGGHLDVGPDPHISSIGASGSISKKRLQSDSDDYRKLREDLSKALLENGVTLDNYLADPEAV
jgi:Domain of unknown function (DUF4062)